MDKEEQNQENDVNDVEQVEKVATFEDIKNARQQNTPDYQDVLKQAEEYIFPLLKDVPASVKRIGAKLAIALTNRIVEENAFSSAYDIVNNRPFKKVTQHNLEKLGKSLLDVVFEQYGIGEHSKPPEEMLKQIQDNVIRFKTELSTPEQVKNFIELNVKYLNSVNGIENVPEVDVGSDKIDLLSENTIAGYVDSLNLMIFRETKINNMSDVVKLLDTIAHEHSHCVTTNKRNIVRKQTGREEITSKQDCRKIVNAIQKDSYRDKDKYLTEVNHPLEGDLIKTIKSLDNAIYYNTPDEVLARHQSKFHIKGVIEPVMNQLGEEDKNQIHESIQDLKNQHMREERFGEIEIQALEPRLNFLFQRVIAHHSLHSPDDADIMRYKQAYAEYLKSKAGGSHFVDKEGCSPEESAQNNQKLNQLINERVGKMFNIIKSNGLDANIVALEQTENRIRKEKREEFDKRKKNENINYVLGGTTHDGKDFKYLSQNTDYTNLPYEATIATKPLPLKDDDPNRL